MGKSRYPVTAAIRHFRSEGIDFSPVTYRYVNRGGAAAAARSLGVDAYRIIKTIVLETPAGSPLMVLMHGDRDVSTKMLARIIGVRHLRPCDPQDATKHTGYAVGGISPFGLSNPMPVYVQKSILALKSLYINGGKRGFLVCITPSAILRLLDATPVDVGIEKSSTAGR